MTLEEKIDKLVLDLIYTGSMLPKGKTIGASMFPEHKQALTSLIKELVAEAKPETWADPDDTDELMRWQSNG